jgi:hypothetical protein
VKIPLGGEASASPITGIFLPQGFSPTLEVDIILYLHGHHKAKPYPPSLSIDEYWTQSKYPNFGFREGVNSGGKKIILVAPTLGPSSEAGNLMDATGLSSYFDQVLAALKAHGPYEPADAVPVLGKLVLACHSGGGKRMRSLAKPSAILGQDL